MKTLTRPPQTPVRPRAVAKAPRRWPRWLAVIAGIVVLILLGVGAIWVLHVEPLATGPERYGIRGRSLDVTTRNVDALGASGSIQIVQMRPNMTFQPDDKGNTRPSNPVLVVVRKPAAAPQ